jgi:hypothetical protein
MSPVKLFLASCICVKVRTGDQVPAHEGNPAPQIQAFREPEKSQQGAAGRMRFYPGTERAKFGQVGTGTSL